MTYLQHQQYLGYQRTARLLKELAGVDISVGGQARIIERVAQRAQPLVNAIRAEVTSSAVVGSDETGARVNGRNWWKWVFVAPQAILHVIRPSRGAEVIQRVMQERVTEVWVSDCYSAQLNAPTLTFQLCLAHT